MEDTVGEAKRRRASGNQDLWFHGSNQKFERWLCPPPFSDEKPELIQHSFISLTKLKNLASKHGLHVCQSSVSPDTRIIDLREPSEAGEAAWQRLQHHPLATQFLVPDNYNIYVNKCKSGDILRPTISNPNDENGRHLNNLTEIAQGHGLYSPLQRAIAGVKVQNIVRSWIEAVLQCAKDDHDAVICSEKSQYRNFEIINFYCFSSEKLSNPLWCRVDVGDSGDVRFGDVVPSVRTAIMSAEPSVTAVGQQCPLGPQNRTYRKRP
jgi:hypothetical protein